jgi:threonine dehydrogenase-like Zn-dependent dehydrogenase
VGTSYLAAARSFNKKETMQALHLKNETITFRTDYPIPKPGPAEALIKVGLAGICSTDLEITKGYAGFQGIPGHEFVGRVEETTDSRWRGRRVVGTINLGCRHCAVCLGKGPEHCPDRTVLGIIGKDGVFADYVTLPLANLHPVPDGIPDQAAVFTEPLAAALRIREQVLVNPSARTAVVGPGRLGILIGQVLRLAGTEVVMLGRKPVSLELPASLDFPVHLVDEVNDNTFDFVVEATGNENGFAHSLRLVRPQGTLVLKSTFQGKCSIDMTKLVVAEITVIGSRCGPFAPALRLLARNDVDVNALIGAEYPLREGIIAFEHAARPGAGKILLRP